MRVWMAAKRWLTFASSCRVSDSWSATADRRAFNCEFSAAENSQLNARRSAVALQESLTRQELANVSQRFAAIQTLINAIPTAKDEKGILDLQARIQVELGMLQNENSKLHVLYQAAQSQAQTERERADEQAIVDIG